jgi:membrane associated rhomboid family serine protease
MDVWAAAIIVIIVAGTAYSYWRQLSYSIVAAVLCVVVFVIQIFSSDTSNMLASTTMYNIEFMPGDLTDPGRSYTLLTSMFSHASFFHLFFNILGIAFIGMVFEQRIGPRPYIVLYLLTGFVGTLVFAAVRWDEPYIAVVGASGAISGVLGGFARLYPNERMSMILFLFPLPPLPIWVIVGIFILLQLVFLGGSTNIAWEAHLGGLAAGIILAPILVKAQMGKGKRRLVPLAGLKRLATTPELKSILARIEREEIPDVRSAWIQEFLSKARCPACGSKIVIGRESVRCERGHLL